MGNVPLNLNWKELLSSKDNDAPPADVGVVPNSDHGLGSSVTDHQIKRVCVMLSSRLSENLPDKGNSLRESLKQWQAELDRRQKLRAQKNSKNMKIEGERESREMGSHLFDDEVNHHHLCQVPETLESVACGVDTHRTHNSSGGVGAGLQHQQQHEEDDKESGSVPVDILETRKTYTFFIEVPGLSKSDIQVTLEDYTVLVVKSNKQRKRDEQEEGSKYLRLESKTSPNKFVRKFMLPGNSNLSSVTAKCDAGVLKVVVEKLPLKHKIVEVKIA